MIRIALTLFYFFSACVMSPASLAFAEDPPNPISPPSMTGVQEFPVEQQLSPEFSNTGLQEFPIEPQLPPEFSDHYSPPIPLEEDHFYQEFFKMISMLGLIIILLLLASWFLKRLLSSRTEQINNTSLIKIVERRMLSPKSAVYVLDVLGKKIAIVESQNGVTSLGDISIKDLSTAEIPEPTERI